MRLGQFVGILLALVFALAACAKGSSARTVAGGPADGEIPGLAGVDDSSPEVTVRGLTLDGPPSEAAVKALAASGKPAPPLPKCERAPSSSKRGPQPQLVIQDGHTAMLMKLELSDDGKTLVSAGIDGVVRVWDTRRGLLLRRIRSGGSTLAVSLSDNADALAVYAPTGGLLTVEAHQLDSGAPPTVVGKGEVSYTFALTPNGKTLVSTTTEVGLFDARSGKKKAKVPLPAFAQAMAMSPKGNLVAAAMEGKLSVVDIAKRRVVSTWTRSDYAEIVDTALKVEMTQKSVLVQTPGGDVVAYGFGKSKGRKLAEGAADIAVAGGSVWVLGSTPSSYLKRLSATTGAKEVEVSASVLPGMVMKVAASEDGSTLALGGRSKDGTKHTIRVLDAATGTVLRTLEGQAAKLTSVAVAPAFDRLATGSLAGLARWSLRGGELTDVVAKNTERVAFGPQGSYLVAMGSARIEQRDAASGAVMRRWSAGYLGAPVPGKHAYITMGSGKVTWFDIPPIEAAADAGPWGDVQAPTGRHVGGLGWMPRDLQVTNDGETLAILGGSRRDATVVHVGAMDLNTGKLEWKAEIDKTTIHDVFMGVSPDGRRLVVSANELTKVKQRELFKGYLRVYDVASGKLLERVEMRTRGPIAFLGNTVAVGGRKPVLLDAKTFAVIADVDVPDTEVTALATHGGRKRFLFGGDSGVTSIVGTDGRVQAMLLSTPDGEYVAATPDGAFKASLDGARHVGWTFTRPLEGFSFDQFGTVMNKPQAVRDRIAKGAGRDGAAREVARPPRVTISKVPGKVDTDSVEFVASVEARAWVERVRVFVNGRPTSDQLVCAKKKTIAVEAPLTAGSNRITVIAYGRDGFASNPVQVDVTSTRKGAQPDLWVITAGVSRYPNLPKHLQLAFADDDAQSIADAVEGLVGAGKPFGQLKRVTLLNEGVTPSNVERSLASLAEMRADDLAVVFLAGHGVRLDDGKMVFLTSGASLSEEGARAASVGWDRIQAVLRAARGRTILMLDACHSGHLSTESIAPNEQLAAELAADNRAGVLVFAASRGSQLSYEVGGSAGASRGLELAWEGPPQVDKRPAEGHGLFTSAVLEALEGDAVDRDRSGAIELAEFIDYVTERVRAASNGRQTPWVVRREMFGDYAIAPAG